MGNKTNKFLLSIFLGIFLMGMVSSANTITLAFPSADASISSSTYILSATLDTNTKDFTNATFFYDDGSSNTTIGTNTTSAGGYATVFNQTWDTTAIDDIDDLVIWVNATNVTGVGLTSLDSSTGVDIDNGNPTATLSSSTFNTNHQRTADQSFTMGLSADNTIGISSCDIFCTEVIDSTVISTTTTTSANACSNSSLTPALFPLVSGKAYNCLVQATDGNTDYTNSSTRKITYVVAESGTPMGGGGIADKIASGGSSQPGKSFFAKIGDFFKRILSWFGGK